MSETLTSVGFFVLRTPALPWDAIEKWCSGLSAARTLKEGGDTASALQADVGLLRNRLRSIVQLPPVQSALYVASPDLCAHMSPWLDGDETEKGCRVEPAVVRYIMRMAGRATPFGLFAGTSIGTFDQNTSLAVCPMRRYVRHIRLDTEYVFDLAHKLSKSVSLLPDLRFQPTPSAYMCGGRLRYYESDFSRRWRTFYLVDVEPSPYLHAALDFALTNAGSTMSEIAESLSSRFDDVSFADALEYVNLLVDAKLLCDTFSPPLTGKDPAVGLVDKLRATKGGAPLATELTEVLAAIELADAVGLEAQPEHYKRIVSRIQSLHGGIDSARMLRADLRKPEVAATISHAIVKDVQRGFELLARITPPPDDSAMRRFVREFQVRYRQCEVPLLQALDEETGIGFDTQDDSGGDASSLLEGIAFHRPLRRTINWNTRTEFLFHKLGEALRHHSTEIALSDTDIKALSTEPATELPAGASVLVAIAATSGEAADQGLYRLHLRKAFGPNSGKLFGRFCEGDADLRKHVEVRSDAKKQATRMLYMQRLFIFRIDMREM
jgi:hypothetical protein